MVQINIIGGLRDTGKQAFSSPFQGDGQFSGVGIEAKDGEEAEKDHNNRGQLIGDQSAELHIGQDTMCHRQNQPANIDHGLALGDQTFKGLIVQTHIHAQNPEHKIGGKDFVCGGGIGEIHPEEDRHCKCRDGQKRGKGFVFHTADHDPDRHQEIELDDQNNEIKLRRYIPCQYEIQELIPAELIQMKDPDEYRVIDDYRKQIREANFPYPVPEKTHIGKTADITVFIKKFNGAGKDKAGHRKGGKPGQRGKKDRPEAPLGEGVHTL